jgi:hypothetical protein
MKTPKLLMIVLVCWPMRAGQQHITIQIVGEVYTATVDDSLSRKMNLQLLPVFSPIIDTSPPLNPYLTTSDSKDKSMLAPKLEDCQHGEPNCPPTMVNDAFLRNAEVNLGKGREQVRDLTQERLPEALEPVRRFLLGNLAIAVHMEEARYEYIRTRAVAPLKAMLDQYCTTSQQGLIQRLGDAPDAETRRELTWADWNNAVRKCYDEKNKYPAEAWKQFVRQYHVRENARLVE